MGATIFLVSFSASDICFSTSRMDVRYSTTLRLSDAPRSASSLRELSWVRSRMLFRYSARRALVAGSRLGSSVPNRRSKTDRGFTSGGIGVSASFHERQLVYAQLKPVSQLPTMRGSSQLNWSDATRVLSPTYFAAI